MFYIYPQMEWAQARHEAERLSQLPVTEGHDDYSRRNELPDGILFSPIGARLPDDRLARIRNDVVRTATEFGFPGAHSGSNATAGFDAKVAALLHDIMEISPNEASRSQVWQFITCYLLQDVVRWRFPGQGGKGTTIERYKGGVRNTFQRLWWRAEVLQLPQADDRYQLLTQLNEDEIVQIMERPTMRSHRRLSRNVAIVFLVELSRSDGLERELLMRESQKRLMRLMPFISFGSLENEELNSIISGVVSATANAISKPVGAAV
jgi:hypothetical protein